MPRKTYPLEPLARLQADRAEAKTRELGRAAAATEAAREKRERAESDREAAREGAKRLRDAERASLAKGDLVVRDLAQGGAWESRVLAEDRERTHGVDSALLVLERARTAESEVRAQAARAHAEAEDVQRHQERWRAADRKEEELLEEDALAEAFRPNKPR